MKTQDIASKTYFKHQKGTKLTWRYNLRRVTLPTKGKLFTIKYKLRLRNVFSIAFSQNVSRGHTKESLENLFLESFLIKNSKIGKHYGYKPKLSTYNKLKTQKKSRLEKARTTLNKIFFTKRTIELTLYCY